jgi:hypothetical protein
MSPKKLSLAGNNEIFPARESLVGDVPAGGDGKTANLFYNGCTRSQVMSGIPVATLHIHMYIVHGQLDM